MIVLSSTVQAELIRGVLVIAIMILIKLVVGEAFHMLRDLSVLNCLVMANLVLLLAYSKLLRQVTLHIIVLLLFILLTLLLSRLIAAI